MYLPSLNRHLIVVEGFVHLNDPMSYVVQGLMPLVGSPKAKRSEVMGQTKSGSKAPDEKDDNEEVYVARNGITGAPPWSQAWGWGSQAGHSLNE